MLLMLSRRPQVDCRTMTVLAKVQKRLLRNLDISQSWVERLSLGKDVILCSRTEHYRTGNHRFDYCVNFTYLFHLCMLQLIKIQMFQHDTHRKPQGLIVLEDNCRVARSDGSNTFEITTASKTYYLV